MGDITVGCRFMIFENSTVVIIENFAAFEVVMAHTIVQAVGCTIDGVR